MKVVDAARDLLQRFPNMSGMSREGLEAYIESMDGVEFAPGSPDEQSAVMSLNRIIETLLPEIRPLVPLERPESSRHGARSDAGVHGGAGRDKWWGAGIALPLTLAATLAGALYFE